MTMNGKNVQGHVNMLIHWLYNIQNEVESASHESLRSNEQSTLFYLQVSQDTKLSRTKRQTSLTLQQVQVSVTGTCKTIAKMQKPSRY